MRWNRVDKFNHYHNINTTMLHNFKLLGKILFFVSFIKKKLRAQIVILCNLYGYRQTYFLQENHEDDNNDMFAQSKKIVQRFAPTEKN